MKSESLAQDFLSSLGYSNNSQMWQPLFFQVSYSQMLIYVQSPVAFVKMQVLIQYVWGGASES